MPEASASRPKRKKRKRKPLRCKPRKQRSPARSSASQQPAELSARRRRRRKPRKVTCRRRRPRPRRRPVRRRTPTPTPAPPAPPRGPGIATPVARYTGAFGVRQAERLLWRAGFGPSPGHAEALAGMGLDAAVRSLTRIGGEPTYTGPEPRLSNGAPLQPADAYGHDHLFWLDRMVRTNQPFVERMALIWHDWFATSNEVVGDQGRMIEQYEMFRARGRGSFMSLVAHVTQDPAMIIWLDQDENRRGRINENYARELMELFTLGADRGAYTEQDVRELARALSGWTKSYTPELGTHNFRFDPNRHDNGAKTIFGKTGNFGWEDAYRKCVEHPSHASFFVEKLWSYFIPTPPSAADRRALERLYVDGGHEVLPVVEAILLHPALYMGPRMVKSPVVLAAGMLRALGRGVDTADWYTLCSDAGQRLFRPPDVSGWDDERWLDTSTTRARWMLVRRALDGRHIVGAAQGQYSDTETPEEAVEAAVRHWGDPLLTPAARASLLSFASTCLPPSMTTYQRHSYRAMRQNALRHLLYASPDLQTA